MSAERWASFWLAVVVVSMFALGVLLSSVKISLAHDMDHPEQNAWYESLKQPDNPTASCCGIADGYWCDGIHTRDGINYCTITDDRVIPNRTPRPLGMEIEIPDRKMMDGSKTRGNPTGHSVVFLSSGEIPVVYCFVMDSGI